MHFATKPKELDAQLQRITNSRELVELMTNDARCLQERAGQWSIIYGQRQQFATVRALLMRRGIAWFDCGVYVSCAREQLFIEGENLFWDVLDPFIRKAPVLRACFTEDWESVPLAQLVRTNLQSLGRIIDDYPFRSV
jgi:hypothetical protein